jgi:hypothetical protein
MTFTDEEAQERFMLNEARAVLKSGASRPAVILIDARHAVEGVPVVSTFATFGDFLAATAKTDSVALALHRVRLAREQSPGDMCVLLLHDGGANAITVSPEAA